VHLERTLVPLADASTNHILATAGVECKLQQPTPISNDANARDNLGPYVTSNANARSL
jgi:hypothetical protein